MKRSEVLDLFEEFEKNHPVDIWKFGEIEVWPIIKMEVFFQWVSTSTKKPLKELKIESAGSKIYGAIRSLGKYLGLFFSRPKVIDNIYCGTFSHRVDYDGLFINRYFEPLIEKDLSKTYIQFEFDSRLNKSYKDPNKIVFTDDFKLPYGLLKVFLKKNTLYAPDLENFISLAQEKLNLPMNGFKYKLINRLQSIVTYSNLFKLLLSKHRPEKIFGLCYYSTPMFALNYTANKLGIPIYDMQHGGQGRLHPMYNFQKIPVSGYNTLPKTFLCWDTTSRSNLQSWLKNQTYHEAETVGNPWVDFQLNNNATILSKEKKIILFTLQDTILPSYILECIQDTPDTYHWWIRVHPRMTEAKSNIIKQLSERNISHKVEFDRAFEYSLPILLKQSVVHISRFSGSIIESALVNTPSIIIDEIGVETYRDYINDGLAVPVLSKNSKDLLDAILKFK